MPSRVRRPLVVAVVAILALGLLAGLEQTGADARTRSRAKRSTTVSRGYFTPRRAVAQSSASRKQATRVRSRRQPSRISAEQQARTTTDRTVAQMRASARSLNTRLARNRVSASQACPAIDTVAGAIRSLYNSAVALINSLPIPDSLKASLIATLANTANSLIAKLGALAQAHSCPPPSGV
jgi:hypothetical protein